jgi:dTDP-4-dehydrorhamnose 3,5-epimerase
MKVTRTELPGVVIIEPKVHGDTRGFFVETFQEERYRELAGIDLPFVQDNQSRSRKGVLRGLHAQNPHAQGRLVRVARGAVFDVVADVNPSSPTFRRWVGTTLADENQRQLWIPPGYVHGFLVLSDVADFEYKCTDYYYPELELGVIWNDPDLGVDWPSADPILSDKDRRLPTLAALTARL